MKENGICFLVIELSSFSKLFLIKSHLFCISYGYNSYLLDNNDGISLFTNCIANRVSGKNPAPLIISIELQ